MILYLLGSQSCKQDFEERTYSFSKNSSLSFKIYSAGCAKKCWKDPTSSKKIKKNQKFKAAPLLKQGSKIYAVNCAEKIQTGQKGQKKKKY